GSRLSTPIWPSCSDPDLPIQTTLNFARRVWRAIQRMSPSLTPSIFMSLAPRPETSQVHAARTFVGSSCGEIFTGRTTVTRLSLRICARDGPKDIQLDSGTGFFSSEPLY